MSRHNPLALIAPIDRVAGWLIDDGTAVTLLSPEAGKGSVFSGGAFLARYPDAQLVAGQKETDVLNQLELAEEKSFALEFSLLLFDQQVSTSTRCEISAELDDMLASTATCDYVLDILLSSPLPKSADIAGAREASFDHQRTSTLISSIVENLDGVSLAWSAWRGMRTNSMVRSQDFESLTGHLIHHGVFRRIVLGACDQTQIEEIKQRLIFDKKLTSKCDPRILTSFLNSVRDGLPPGKRQTKPRSPMDRDDADRDELVTQAARRSVEPRMVATEKRDWATHTVSQIANCFAQGDDENGYKFLEELINDQTDNVRDHSHVVKSLCNLANQCTIAGRREISLNALQRALSFPDGADAVLFLQIGNEFRELDHYTEALSCYRKAQVLDHGQRADWIRNEIIRLSVHQGEYETALEQYLAIPEIEHDPSALRGLATLRRRMGDLKEATRVYSRVLMLGSEENHVMGAEAGLAECSKQAGNIHRAIRQYLNLFKTHGDLEPAAAKAYELGLAYLFRLSRQFSKAEAHYLNQLVLYPRDCDIHFQLAKHYALTGNRVAEKEHFKKARRQPLSGIAADLFAVAMGIAPLSDSESSSEVLGPRRLNDYLPEDRGLAGCSLALQALKDDEPHRVGEILNGVKYVDRIHSEFGTILQFHAERRLDSRFDYSSDHRICRVAKRGYSTLKSAAHSIASGDLAGAFELEERMCLFVA